jgi:predicted nucleic acid-binding protein
MFFDTSSLLCLLDEREPSHQQANHFLARAARRMTHSYVLAELIALAHVRGIPRLRSLNFAQRIAENPDFEVIWVEQSLHDDALNLLFARLDKTYSLCDAVSFVLMREHGIRDALTTDHHFEQEGFNRLLKD